MGTITSAGYRKYTFETYRTRIENELLRLISENLTLNERTFFGNWRDIVSDHLSEIDDVIQMIYDQTDPDKAQGALLEGLAKLTGVFRRGASKGLVTAQVTLTASVNFSAGTMVAHVINDPTNRWVNQSAFSGGPGVHDVVFISEKAGAHAVAPASTLTIIASPLAGWSAINNSASATPGQDIESIEALRIRRNASVAIAGSATLPAIKADVAAVEGVLAVVLVENTTLKYTTLPPKTFRVIVWDGATPAANNVEIAQAIFNSKAATSESIGNISANATNPVNGALVPIKFDRATQVICYVTCHVKAPAPGADVETIKSVIIGNMPKSPGENVIFERLKDGIFGVGGVVNILNFRLGTAPNPSGQADLVMALDQIGTLDVSNITVTVTP